MDDACRMQSCCIQSDAWFPCMMLPCMIYAPRSMYPKPVHSSHGQQAWYTGPSCMPHAELPSALGHAILHVWGYPGPSGCMLTISSHLSEPMLSADGGADRLDRYSVRSQSVRNRSHSQRTHAEGRSTTHARLPPAAVERLWSDLGYPIPE